MKKFLKIKFLCSIFIFAPVHGLAQSPSDNVQKNLAKYREILESPNPIEIYRKDLPQFRFLSKSLLELAGEASKETPKTGETGQEGKDDKEIQEEDLEMRPMRAKSDLVVLGKDEMYLERKLFTEEFPIQLWVKGREVFLREKETKDPSKVTFQKEFERWFERAIKEVLGLFKMIETENVEWNSPSDQLTCAKIETGELCFSRDTHLPISGQAQKDVSEALNLSTQFDVINEVTQASITWPGESQEEKASETP